MAKSGKSKTAKPKSAKPKTAKPKTAKSKVAKSKGAKPKTAKSKGGKPKKAAPNAQDAGFCPCLTNFYSMLQRRPVSAPEAEAAKADGMTPGGAVIAGFSPNGISSPVGFGAVAQTSAAWNGGTMGQPATLKVHFLDAGLPGMRDKVVKYAKMWSEVCGVTFDFDAGSVGSHIRVKFNSPGFRSYIGTESEGVVESMWLGFKGHEKEQDIQRLVLHEFGHAIGLCHEHQHPERGFKWNFPVAVPRLAGGLPPNTSREEIEKQLELGAPNGRKFQIEPFDPDSIMLYRISRDMVIGDFDPAWDKDNFKLSKGDKRIAKMIYGPGTGPDGDDEVTDKKEPRELKVDGPALSDEIVSDVDVDLFFFNAPRLGKYTISVQGDAQVHVDITDKDGKPPHPGDGGENTTSRSVGMTMLRLLDDGRQNIRLTGSKHAQGFSKGKYTINVTLKPPS